MIDNSLVNSSSNNKLKLSMGEIKVLSRNKNLRADNSDSTLNARAPLAHLNSQMYSQATGNHHGRSSTLLSDPETNSSQNLNQRQVVQ